MPDPRSNVPDAAETPAVPVPRFRERGILGPTGQFVLAFALAMAVCLTAIAGFNYAMDPRAEFVSGVGEPLVANQVAWRVDWLEEAKSPPRTVVLGNSQAHRLDGDALEDVEPGPVMNFAVSGASLRDEAILYDYVSEEAPDLEQIVVTVGLRQARTSEGVHPDLRRTGPTAAHIDGGPSEGLPSRLVSTLTADYVEDSLRAGWFALADAPEPRERLGEDATVHLRDVHREVDEGTFDADARVEHRLDRFAGQMASYSGHDPAAFAQVETLVEQARADGVTVRLFTPPVHPRLAENLENTTFPQHHEELVKALTGLCDEGVHLHDLNDPRTLEPYGMRQDRFYDAIHTFGENAEVVGAALADPNLDRCREDRSGAAG